MSAVKFPASFEPIEESEAQFPASFEPIKEEPSRLRSLLSAIPKGVIKGVQGINPLAPRGPVPTELGLKLTEQVLPTQEKPTEQFLEKVGEIAPYAAIGPEGLGSKALQVVGGALAGHIAKQNEVGPIGQAISEAIGMSFPGLAKSIGKGATAIAKTVPEKLPSGITKPFAVEAKHAEKGIISPAHQEKAISNLNEEAGKLAESTVQRELPIAEKIQQGHDFESAFQKEFESLKRIADETNPKINILSIKDFLSKTSKKYENIPTLHPDAKKIVNEVKAFNKKPEDHLSTLLKIFRSNNQKRKNIFETSRISGRQQEYVDFLGDMNRAITKSIENTLPKDSPWVFRFKENNSDYANYKNALKTDALLQPILGRKPTAAGLEKLSKDKRTFEKLKLALGEKGAQEIVQISGDLKKATESIKRIPAKELKAWDSILPLSIFIPHAHGLGAIVSLKKGLEWAKRGYGYLLATPARRRLYDNVLKSIIEKDLDTYTKASNKLLKDINKKED